MNTMLAPAKINWTLCITGRRPDNYHNILSLMQCVSLYDKLHFQLSDELILKTSGSSLDVSMKENLIFKAAELLRLTTNTSIGALIELYKEIPTQAGLGGGSSDAAITLIELNRLWKCGLSINELAALGAKLGSDIPFFVKCGYAVIEGRGDVITPLINAPSYDIILIKPDYNISTPWAYQKITRSQGDTHIYSNDTSKYCFKLNQALISRDITLIQSLMKNDFEPILEADIPIIKEIKTNLIKQGAFAAILSGSGSAIFGVYSDEKTALTALPKLMEIYPDYWIRHVNTG